ELWTTDGTAAGTVTVPGLFSQPVDISSPTSLTDGYGTLYFSHDDGPVPGSWRQLWRYTPPNQPALTAPAAPAALTATVPSGNEVDLSWTDQSNNESSWRLERSTSAAFDAIDKTVTLPAGTTRFTDAAVTRGATYYYRVRAVNAAGESSNAVTGPVL